MSTIQSRMRQERKVSARKQRIALYINDRCCNRAQLTVTGYTCRCRCWGCVGGVGGVGVGSIGAGYCSGVGRGFVGSCCRFCYSNCGLSRCRYGGVRCCSTSNRTTEVIHFKMCTQGGVVSIFNTEDCKSSSV